MAFGQCCLDPQAVPLQQPIQGDVEFVDAGVEDAIKADSAGDAERSGDVAVQEGSDNGKGFGLGGTVVAAFEHPAQGPRFDIGGGRVPVRDGFDIHGEI